MKCRRQWRSAFGYLSPGAASSTIASGCWNRVPRRGDAPVYSGTPSASPSGGVGTNSVSARTPDGQNSADYVLSVEARDRTNRAGPCSGPSNNHRASTF